MKKGTINYRGVEASTYPEWGSGDIHAHLPHFAHIRNMVVYLILQHALYTSFFKHYRTACMQPLVEAESSGSPFPSSARF